MWEPWREEGDKPRERERVKKKEEKRVRMIEKDRILGRESNSNSLTKRLNDENQLKKILL